MRGTFTAALLIFACTLLATPASRAAEWKLVKYGGRDHLTLENVAEFYGMGKVQRAKNDFTIKSGPRSLRGTRNSKDLFINNLKFILSYPISEHNGKLLVSRMDLTKLIEPVMRPSRIKHAAEVDTVILDPGHGGHDRGARGQWGFEADYTLDVARRTRDLLLQQGFKVYMTRDRNVFIPLEDRARFANKFPNAIFISIHFNHGKSSTATGLETFTLAPRGVPSMMSDGPRMSDLNACPGNVHDAANMALATATHAAMVSTVGGFDRGIKRARFHVIRNAKIPAVLVECGFLSNLADSRKIASSSYRQVLASAVSRAVRNYRDAVNPQLPDSVGPLVGLKKPNAGAPETNEPVPVVKPTATQ
jgi:N-acetylmuramoyl-L-alanine amidase